MGELEASLTDEATTESLPNAIVKAKEYLLGKGEDESDLGQQRKRLSDLLKRAEAFKKAEDELQGAMSVESIGNVTGINKLREVITANEGTARKGILTKARGKLAEMEEALSTNEAELNQAMSATVN